MSTAATLIGRGLRSAQPTPAAGAAGQLYYVTDELKLERWSGSAWQAVSVGVAADAIFNAAGDLVVGTGADTAARLAIGTNGYVLTSNGTTAAWAAAASGAVATDTIFDAAGDLVVGTGSNTAARLAIGSNTHVLTSNGTTASWAAPSGGGGALTTPVIVQAVRANGTNTIVAAASGQRLIACITSYGGTVTGVACTNVTWAQIGSDISQGGNKTSVWLGIATGTTGTSVTFTGSGTILNHIIEVADAVSTLDVAASRTNGSGFNAMDALGQGMTAGALVVISAHADNTSSIPFCDMSAPHVMIPMATSIQATTCAIGYAPDGDLTGRIMVPGTSGAILMVSIV